MRFPSLESLRAAHGDLLRRAQSGHSPELLDEIADFVQRGRATGALLDADGDRWSAQSLLDYWTTTLYRASREVPDGTLDEFDPSLAPTLPDARCPYLGLDAFQESRSDVFFGRQRVVEEWLGRLDEQRLLAVLGSSGSGKSSIVLAGLVPALKAGHLPGSEGWRYSPPPVPGVDPLARLARLVQPAGVDPDEWVRSQAEHFRADPGHLARLIADQGAAPTLIVIDQFEELFTLCEDQTSREAFLANVLTLVEASTRRHSVILTMRSDFEEHVARVPALHSLFNRSQVRVPALDAVELRDAIERPAALVGLRFENGIVDELLRELLGEPAGLPLLQFALLKLWERRERNRVTWRAYRQLGGARLALAR